MPVTENRRLGYETEPAVLIPANGGDAAAIPSHDTSTAELMEGCS